jgi:hypothetical protein
MPWLEEALPLPPPPPPLLLPPPFTMMAFGLASLTHSQTRILLVLALALSAAFQLAAPQPGPVIPNSAFSQPFSVLKS